MQVTVPEENSNISNVKQLTGPIKWPIFGSLFYLTSFKERVFMDWVKHYGNIYDVKIGSKTVVIVNGYQGVKAVLEDKQGVYSSRDHRNNLQNHRKPGQGLFFCPENNVHKKLKPFLVQNLSKLKSHTDKTIKTEIKKMIVHLNKVSNKPVDIQHVIRSTTANILLQTLYSKSYEYGNPDLEKIMKLCCIGNIERDMGTAKILTLDWIIHLPSMKSLMNTKRSEHSQVKAFFNNLHEKRLTGPEEITDLSSAFAKFSPDPLLRDQLFCMSEDSMTGGTQTTKSQFSWILLELLKSGDALKKVEDEIESVFEKSDDYFDKDLYSQLHYCRAAIEEGLRMRPIAPTASPHFTTRPSTLLGYHVPAGTNIHPNLWSVHRDPVFWSPDPDNFRPERHLDENGRFSPSGRVLTFSLGRRQCGGYRLAKQVILSCLVNLIANFRVEFEFPWREFPGEGTSILIYTPPQFNVVLKPRN